MGNIDPRFYLSLFLRRLPRFILIVVIVLGAGYAASRMLQPTYVASARILVESPQIPVDMAKSTVPTGAMEQVQIIEQSVLSRDNLVALADRFQLYAGEPAITKPEIVNDMRQRATIEPLAVGGGSGDPPAMVLEVSFASPHAQLSADVTNELVQMILQRDAELRSGRANDTLKFFTLEVNRLEASLMQIEANILAFKNAHVNALPDSLDFRRNQQGNLQQRLLLLDQEEASLRAQQAQLKATGRVQGGPPTPEEKTLADMRQALSTQLMLFSPDSPTIKSLRARIAALDQRIREAGAAAAAKLGAGSDSVDAQLAAMDERLAAIAASRTALTKDFNALQVTIEQTPANETALDALDRDHNNIRAQYDAAVSRLAEATTGQQIEARLKGERLSLIEGALPPLKPAGRTRFVVLMGSALGALGLALAAVVGPELFNKSIRRPVELVDKLDIYPMVTVPYIARQGERMHRAMSIAAVALAAVIIVPLLLVVVVPQNSRIDAFVNQALGTLQAATGR